ncbi:MAG: T9SS type A sorting domain-containing protein [Fluviicola sp.]|nr:T9SS type A sorting domain-containing protein [Fluviicola sp.]
MKQLLMICMASLITNWSLSQLQISRYVNASAGAEMSNSSLQLSYTIGETFTNTLTQSGSTNTLGFQQSGLSTVTIEENVEITIALYPNPVSEQLTLTTTSTASYSYKIYDVTGRIVVLGGKKTGKTIINVQSLVEGKYFLEYISKSNKNTHLKFIVIH